jgi:DNA-binding transcriptional LysR family regulator
VVQAQRVLDEAARVKELAKQGKDPLSGALRVGVIYTIGPYLLPALIRQLVRDTPQMPLLLNENLTVKLLELLKNGEVDVAILALPLPESGVMIQPVYDEQFVVGVPRAHPWAKKRAVSADDLKKETMLLLGSGHCFRDQVLEVCPELSRFSRRRRGHPEDLRGLVAGDDPPHGGLRARRDGAADELDAGEGAARFADRLPAVQEAGARSPRGAGLAQELHAGRGDRGAAQGDTEVPAVRRAASSTCLPSHRERLSPHWEIAIGRPRPGR